MNLYLTQRTVKHWKGKKFVYRTPKSKGIILSIIRHHMPRIIAESIVGTPLTEYTPVPMDHVTKNIIQQLKRLTP